MGSLMYVWKREGVAGKLLPNLQHLNYPVSEVQPQQREAPDDYRPRGVKLKAWGLGRLRKSNGLALGASASQNEARVGRAQPS